MRKGFYSLSGVIMFIVVLLVCVFGCTSAKQKLELPQNGTVVFNGTTNATTTSTIAKNTFRTLTTIGTMYKVVMTTAGELYKDGELNDIQKQKIIDVGNIAYASYHIGVDSYDAYMKLSSPDNELKLLTTVKLAVTNYNELIVQYNTLTSGIKGVQQWKSLQ